MKNHEIIAVLYVNPFLMDGGDEPKGLEIGQAYSIEPSTYNDGDEYDSFVVTKGGGRPHTFFYNFVDGEKFNVWDYFEPLTASDVVPA